MKVTVRKQIALAEEILVEEAVTDPDDFPWDAVYRRVDARFHEQNERLMRAMVKIDELPEDVKHKVITAMRLLVGEKVPDAVEVQA